MNNYDEVEEICMKWVADGHVHECFWESWPDCPTPDKSLTPAMVLGLIDQIKLNIATKTEPVFDPMKPDDGAKYSEFLEFGANERD